MPLAVSVASFFLGNEQRRNAVVQMLIFALATPVGLVAAVVFLGHLSREVIGTVVALSAGVFIYLGATDMLPEINHASHTGDAAQTGDRLAPGRWIRWEPTVFVLIGMAVSFIPHMLLEGVLPH